MSEFALKFWAGLVAYLVAFVAAAGPLLSAAYLSARRVKDSETEEYYLLQGNRSMAIRLSARMVCQAILVRHAVFATVAVVRSLFVYRYPFGESIQLIIRSIVLIIVINFLALASILVAEATFKKFTRKINEDEEIHKDNVAVAIFVAFSLLAITLVLDPGMEDLANAFIPLGRTGMS